MQFERAMAGGDFDCDTELCLTPGGGRQRSNTGLMRRAERSAAVDIAAGEKPPEMTMLYGGQVRVCDVTEIQARAILCMARREMKEMMGSSSNSYLQAGSTWSDASLPPFKEPLLLINPGLSMKRSLQLFLQKRKARICDHIPY
ncbi:protein TIFY 5A-like isoform X2 [Phalaenopsis equestris]|uniref:protein TIFY 5A-like isoform X2 n=1 Tax=Phalaenopsis equestris TaxID=78828 RepID=UPI0009E258CE|nr:protein TIFY 5A-like isoform X2 [Phalaenopsis equestris]